MNENRITVKILGSINDVKSTAKKIETLFPLFLESPLRMNDSGDGCHIFISLPVEPKEYDILDDLKRARQAAENEDKNGFGYTPQESAKTVTPANHTNTLNEAVSK